MLELALLECTREPIGNFLGGILLNRSSLISDNRQSVQTRPNDYYGGHLAATCCLYAFKIFNVPSDKSKHLAFSRFTQAAHCLLSNSTALLLVETKLRSHETQISFQDLYSSLAVRLPSKFCLIPPSLDSSLPPTSSASLLRLNLIRIRQAD